MADFSGVNSSNQVMTRQSSLVPKSDDSKALIRMFPLNARKGSEVWEAHDMRVYDLVRKYRKLKEARDESHLKLFDPAEGGLLIQEIQGSQTARAVGPKYKVNMVQKRAQKILPKNERPSIVSAGSSECSEADAGQGQPVSIV